MKDFSNSRGWRVIVALTNKTTQMTTSFVCPEEFACMNDALLGMRASSMDLVKKLGVIEDPENVYDLETSLAFVGNPSSDPAPKFHELLQKYMDRQGFTAESLHMAYREATNTNVPFILIDRAVKGMRRPPDVAVAMLCVILRMSDEEALELHHSE